MDHRSQARRTRVAGLVLAAAALAGCGGDDDGGPVEPPANRPPTVPSITVGSTWIAFLPGEQVVLTGVSTDPDADPLTFTWSLTNPRGSTLSTDSGTTTTWTAGDQGTGGVVVTLSVTDGIAAARTTQVTLTVGSAVAGTLPAGAVWTSAQSPYVFTDNVTVAAGQTLEIQPGVQLILRQKPVGMNREKTRLIVLGTLLARGAPLSGQILLRGGEAPTLNQTQHRGIDFGAGSGGQMLYVRVERADAGVSYKGGGTLALYGCRVTQCIAGLEVGGGSTVTLRRTLIDQALGTGVIVGDGDIIARESSIRDCGSIGLQINPVSQISTADIDSCVLDQNPDGNLFLRDVCAATVHHTNFFPAEDSPSVVFDGNAGPLASVPVDLTECFWGLLLSADPGDEAAVTNELRLRAFENGLARAFDVYPYSAIAHSLPTAP